MFYENEDAIKSYIRNKKGKKRKNNMFCKFFSVYNIRQQEPLVRLSC